MKFFHLSDLHIGKHLHSYSLYDLQRDVFAQIVHMAKEYRPNAILISGDIYDKAVPSGEAYTLFDTFLSDLSEITPRIPVLIIAGNHDSAERLNYAGGFLERHGIHLSVMPPRSLEESIKKITLEDEYGEVDFYLLPFMKPAYVRYLFEEGKTISYQSAIQAVIEQEQIDEKRRNVLLSHQFYINGDHEPETCESELSYISIGGVDSVDIAVVEKFDYVALGHIHGAQSVGKNHIRYCGTPLKYSVSEEKHHKAILFVTLGEKGSEVDVLSLPLKSLRDVRSEKGKLEEVLSRATEDNRHDYLSITLTDEEELYQPKDKLEEVYDHILEIKVDNQRTRQAIGDFNEEEMKLDPFSAFMSFFEEIHKVPMSEEEKRVLLEVIEKVQDEEEA